MQNIVHEISGSLTHLPVSKNSAEKIALTILPILRRLLSRKLSHHTKPRPHPWLLDVPIRQIDRLLLFLLFLQSQVSLIASLGCVITVHLATTPVAEVVTAPASHVVTALVPLHPKLALAALFHALCAHQLLELLVLF